MRSASHGDAAKLSFRAARTGSTDDCAAIERLRPFAGRFPRSMDDGPAIERMRSIVQDRLFDKLRMTVVGGDGEVDDEEEGASR